MPGVAVSCVAVSRLASAGEWPHVASGEWLRVADAVWLWWALDLAVVVVGLDWALDWGGQELAVAVVVASAAAKEILWDHHHVGIGSFAQSLKGMQHESVTQPLDYHPSNQTATRMICGELVEVSGSQLCPILKP